jgi:hypothetical protein
MTLLVLTVVVHASGCGDDDEDVVGSTSGVADTSITFYRDVAPILYEHCVSCHAPGGIGSMSLLDYQSAALLAGLIKDKTATRAMPPWPADNSGACNTFEDARWLSDQEIATLGAWVDGGAIAGDPADGPSLPAPPPGLDHVSATLDMGVEYIPDDTLDDDYRCFVLDPGLSETQYLTGYQVRAGDARVVHHVILFALDSQQAEDQALAMVANDGTGYPCIGGAGVPAARFVAGWAPGGGPTQYPEGTGLMLPAGRKMILQVHYNLAQGALPDRTRVDLQLAPTVEHAAQITRISNTKLALPPGQKAVAVEAQLVIPEAGTLYGVAPHMHTLGRSQRVEKVGSGGTSCVVDVPAWDFHWQQLYFYQQPMALAAGDVLNLTCVYDTIGQTQTVTNGEGTDDEMCLALLYVVADGGSAPACAQCGDVLGGSASAEELCEDASEAFEALQQCACGAACEAECSDTCASGMATSSCAACAKELCAAEVAACVGGR